MQDNDRMLMSSITQSFVCLRSKLNLENQMQRFNKVKATIIKRHNQLKHNQPNYDKMRNLNNNIESILRNKMEHRMSIEEIEDAYKVNINLGLSNQEAKAKLESQGHNIITYADNVNPLLLFLKEMADPFSLLIWFLIVLSVVGYIIMQDSNSLWLSVILLITIVSGAILSFNFDQQSINTMNKFKNIIPHYASVLRQGSAKTILAQQVVVGDIVLVSKGCDIPCDIRVLQADDMKINNAVFTGQTANCDVDVACTNDDNPFDSKNILFAGSNCTQGTCKGIAFATGKNILIAQLASVVLNSPSKVPIIEQQISRYVLYMTIFAVSFGIITFLMAIVIGFLPIVAGMLAIGVTVASAPTILNLIVIVMLTISVRDLSKASIFCKNYKVIQTLGSMTCLCLDKTGTLTISNIAASRLYINNSSLKVRRKDNSRFLARQHNYHRKPHHNRKRISVKNQKQQILIQILNANKTFNYLHKCAVLSSTAIFDRSPPTKDITHIYSQTNISEQQKQQLELQLRSEWEAKVKQMKPQDLPTIGGITQSGLIKFFTRFGDIESMRKNYQILTRNDQYLRRAFNSSDRYSLCLVNDYLENDIESQQETISKEKNICIYKKGAVDEILKNCKYIMIDGVVKLISQQESNKALKFCLQRNSKGERTLAFSMKILKQNRFYKNTFKFNMDSLNFPIDNQIFLGALSFSDPPKPGIENTIKLIRNAGIKTLMLTGDHQATAVAIAKECNIITDEAPNKQQDTLFQANSFIQINGKKQKTNSHSIVVTGDQLLGMSIKDLGANDSIKDQKLISILQKQEIVFARIDPGQKLKIVEKLCQLGHVVGFIGDGVNDAPAVKQADVGISMGSGSETTKDMAGIIIADDDMNKIVFGIAEGRRLFDNLKKSISYVMTSQFSEFAPFIVLLALRIPIPVFTLLIDGVVDFIPSIALAYEPGELGIMTRTPKGRQEHLVTWKLISQCSGWMGCSSFFCCLCSYYFCMNDFGFNVANLLGKSNIPILLPQPNDAYNPTDPYFGNSNLRAITTCNQFYSKAVGVDWINSAHPTADLRMSALVCHESYGRVTFSPNMVYSECKVQQISVYTSRPVCYTTEAAKYGQTAYMYANVVNQMFNLFIVKARRESVFTQRLDNPIIFMGLIVEVMLSLVLSETYFMVNLIGTRDCIFRHYGITGIAFGIVQLTLDQTRKYLIRHLPQAASGKPNWFQRTTLW